jgi:glycine C-acetyltransferase
VINLSGRQALNFFTQKYWRVFVNEQFQHHLSQQLANIEQAGLFKRERLITSPQSAHVSVGSEGAKPKQLINLCANNYLGLAQHPEVNAAAKAGLEEWGYGMASVRFICGTQTLHKKLENKLSEFLKTEDTILYPSCFDANGGLFETLFGAEDAIISDQLNHASIIDGIRLCKAKRYRYNNSDMADLEAQLQAADKNGARFKLISTDGVFSMDGYIARLDEICDLAQKYHALVHFDDAHATGFIGAGGRGTHEYRSCMDRVDIITGTLGKALGGASGGYTSARKEVVELLRQRSRPYLFSNTVAPPVVAGAIKALELVSSSNQLRDQLTSNTAFFREELSRLGFDLLPGEHPIVPVMLHDAALAGQFANAMMRQGVYVAAFSYPVVPDGKARIRTQMSAALSQDDLEQAIEAFATVKKQLAI